MNEEWKAIPDWAEYEASTTGFIRRRSNGHILKPNDNSKGNYHSVSLYRAGARRAKKLKVHALVASAFLGPRPAGYTVNHKNGVKSNNSVENLEYCTLAENRAHASRMGLNPFGSRNGMYTHPESRPQGSRNGFSKLTEELVLQMREEYASGSVTFVTLSERYGIGRHAIGKAVRGDTWKHTLEAAANVKRRSDG